jgi:hypothetical protein
MARRRPNLCQKSNGKWLARLRIHGPQRQKTFQTRAEAERWLAEMQLRRARNEPAPTFRRIRFPEFAREWLRDYARPTVSPATHRDYETALRVHLVPELGRFYLDQITRKTLVELIAD